MGLELVWNSVEISERGLVRLNCKSKLMKQLFHNNMSALSAASIGREPFNLLGGSVYVFHAPGERDNGQDQVLSQTSERSQATAVAGVTARSSVIEVIKDPVQRLSDTCSAQPTSPINRIPYKPLQFLLKNYDTTLGSI